MSAPALSGTAMSGLAAAAQPRWLLWLAARSVGVVVGACTAGAGALTIAACASGALAGRAHGLPAGRNNAALLVTDFAGGTALAGAVAGDAGGWATTGLGAAAGTSDFTDAVAAGGVATGGVRVAVATPLRCGRGSMVLVRSS